MNTVVSGQSLLLPYIVICATATSTGNIIIMHVLCSLHNVISIHIRQFSFVIFIYFVCIAGACYDIEKLQIIIINPRVRCGE